MHTQANCENANTRELEVEKEQSIAHNTNMNMIYELQKYMQKGHQNTADTQTDTTSPRATRLKATLVK